VVEKMRKRVNEEEEEEEVRTLLKREEKRVKEKVNHLNQKEKRKGDTVSSN
jgi:hypothetical protein